MNAQDSTRQYPITTVVFVLRRALWTLSGASLTAPCKVAGKSAFLTAYANMANALPNWLVTCLVHFEQSPIEKTSQNKKKKKKNKSTCDLSIFGRGPEQFCQAPGYVSQTEPPSGLESPTSEKYRRNHPLTAGFGPQSFRNFGISWQQP